MWTVACSVCSTLCSLTWEGGVSSVVLEGSLGWVGCRDFCHRLTNTFGAIMIKAIVVPGQDEVRQKTEAGMLVGTVLG